MDSKLNIKSGNILNATEDIICHQVNCMGVMGAGLARQIKNAYLKTFDMYQELCSYSKRSELLGELLLVPESSKYIANIFGQEFYGTKRVQTNTHALLNGLAKVCAYALNYNLTVAIPYGIGCGLAGGDWNMVQKLILQAFENHLDILTLYKYRK